MQDKTVNKNKKFIKTNSFNVIMDYMTAEEIRELEKKSEAAGVSKLQLMENAGKKIYEIMAEKLGLEGKKVLIACYHGNNGGDGFVAARYLADVCEVDVLFLGDKEKMKSKARVNYALLSKRYDIQQFTDYDIDYDSYDIIVDAIFGIGIEGDINGSAGFAIDFINNAKAYKVSVDVPSGIDPDTGKAANKHIEPDLIITLHAMKKGLKKFKDKTVVADIGIK